MIRKIEISENELKNIVAYFFGECDNVKPSNVFFNVLEGNQLESPCVTATIVTNVEIKEKKEVNYR